MCVQPNTIQEAFMFSLFLALLITGAIALGWIFLFGWPLLIVAYIGYSYFYKKVRASLTERRLIKHYNDMEENVIAKKELFSCPKPQNTSRPYIPFDTLQEQGVQFL